MSDTSAEKIDSNHEEENMRGTLISVFLIGGFILITWLIMFYLYWVRI